MKRSKPVLWILLGIFALFLLFGLYNPLCVQRYEIDAEGIHHSIKIALIADLHSCRYGEQESALIENIDAQNPHIVLLSGDIFDDQIADSNTAVFLKAIGQKYPCYYVTGNHEYWSGSDAFHEKNAHS